MALEREVSRTAELASVNGLNLVRRIIGVAVALVGLLLSALHELNTSTGELALALCISWAGCHMAVWDRNRGIAGASTIYVMLFGVFHCGLVIALALGGEAVLIGGGDNQWVLSPALGPAILAVNGAFVALSVGTILVARGAAAVGPSQVVGVHAEDAARRSTTIAGGAGVVLGISLIAVVLNQSGGPGVLFVGYGEFLEAVGGAGLFGYGVILLGFGIAFLVASGGRASRVGWVLMFCLAVVGLPLGMRGTVLFPAMALLVIEGKRRRIPTMPFLAVGYIGLAVISLLRRTRMDGVEGLFTAGWKNFLPLEGLAEMGYSLYPTVVVQGWMDSGLAPWNGATFFAPAIRFVEGLFGNAPPGDVDFRLFNVEVASRVGQIGGSPVAEGIRNGGFTGAILLMVVLGVLVAFADRLGSGAYSAAASAVILLPLFIGVRNSFAPVFVQWIIGFVLLAVASRVGKSAKRRRGQN